MAMEKLLFVAYQSDWTTKGISRTFSIDNAEYRVPAFLAVVALWIRVSHRLNVRSFLAAGTRIGVGFSTVAAQ